MNNERAIELLHRLQDEQFDGEYGDERREALEMAVRALKQNLVKESGGLVQDLVKDCISRQAAMVVFENSGLDDDSKDTVVRVLEQLPSAQFATDINVGDKISRKWLMECVNEGWIKFDTEKDENIFIHLVRDIAPSAQPQWIPSSERLPDHNQQILAYFADIDRIMLISYNSHGITLMTAWMPLPEPYDGGDAK